jgi:hypothetical protein
LEPPKGAGTDNVNTGGVSGGGVDAGANAGVGGFANPDSGGSSGAGGTGGMMSTGGQGGAGGVGGAPPAGGMGGDGDDVDAGETDPTNDRDTGWSDACGDVTHSGHCNGDVYEWCDYFARGLKQLDCGALGMTCHAGLQPGDSVETNGCVGDPCTEVDEVCDANLRIDCHDGHLLVTDCHKLHGPESSCELRHDDVEDRDSIRCARDQPCDTPNVLWCDEELEVICDEEGKLYLIDCQAHAEDGRCVAPIDSEPYCDPRATE